MLGSGLEPFARFAPLDAINQPWAQAIIRRGQNLAYNAGSVEQPWSITREGRYKTFGGTTLESIAPFWKAPSNSDSRTP